MYILLVFEDGVVREFVFEVGVFGPVSIDFVVFLVGYRVVDSNFSLFLMIVWAVLGRVVTCSVLFVVASVLI